MATQTVERPQAFNRRLYVPMILGSILNPVNSSMIAVSLIPIGIYFGASPAQTAWLVSGLYLATAIGQPVVGRLVDMFGPRRVFLIGTSLTGIGGIIGALAPSLGVLIAARVIIGFGTCAGFPAAMSLIRSESRRTGRSSPASILTVLSISTQTIAVIGPTLGGLLVGLGGWRTIFSVNIPLSLTCLVLGGLVLPKAAERQAKSRLDLAGMAVFSAMLVSLMLFLMDPHLRDLWLLAITIASAAGFTARELRTAQPFIDVRVLSGNAPLIATYGRTLFTYVISYAFLYGYTQWLEDGRGLTATQAGLVLLPIFGTGIVVAAITGRSTQVRGKLLTGSTAQVVACALLLVVSGSTAIWLLLVIAAVLGLPQGLNSLANQNALYYQADPARTGSSAGLLRTFGYLGALVASAASAGFFGQRADTSGMHHLGVFLLVIAVLLLAACILDRSLGLVGQAKTPVEQGVS